MTVLAQVGSKLREPVSKKDISKGVDDLIQKLFKRLSEKGYGSYASRHEILGILVEEMDEVMDEVRINTPRGYLNFRKELLDVAVGALFGYICMSGQYIKPPKR